MLLYRLTRCIYANDLSGSGARLYGGRWNSEGKAMLYLASSRSLSVLEALVHLRPANIPNDYCMVIMDIPDDFAIINENQLLPNWRDPNDMDVLKQIGNIFLYEKKNLMLRVPSAIVNEEFNYLVNPLHPAAQKITLTKVQPFSFDKRLAVSPL